MVTAEGELIEVSENSYPDLFWGLRGAGTNFGIITSATYQLHEPTNNNEILVVDMIFPPQANASYFNAVEALSRNQSADLGATTMMQYNATAGVVSILPFSQLVKPSR
jgi:FAD/FMN-containing dehydrogenase